MFISETILSTFVFMEGAGPRTGDGVGPGTGEGAGMDEDLQNHIATPTSTTNAINPIARPVGNLPVDGLLDAL
jgi:hypothetical protein